MTDFRIKPPGNEKKKEVLEKILSIKAKRRKIVVERYMNKLGLKKYEKTN